MAYLETITLKCEHPGCNATAKVILVTYINERRGRFCKVHGASELAKREAWEQSPQGIANRMAG